MNSRQILAAVLLPTGLAVGLQWACSPPGRPAPDQTAIDSPAASEPVAPPDIVVIILDAARADRFGFAGHHRDTSPNLDRLALESRVFPTAFALAPYTLCSIPTMITGLSFFDHGVVDGPHALSLDATTLAERLREAGYRTACFSATPNNSRARGFDQGYDTFRELWTEGPQRTTRRAHFAANEVIRWLGETATDRRPLHLQVHLLPPHAPYDPIPDFDTFTDAGYDGPCDGYQRTLTPLDDGELEATAECLDHLLALYDGNLKEADAAVGLILDALRRRGRWSETAVLVTSDHGEAFMEHGRMEHNSTLYTEMLHVPFILRLPESMTESRPETGRLVTLADVSPTLLGLAGLSTEISPDGLDLLADDPVDQGRFLVSRTADTRPVMGLRGPRWSLMIGASGSGALYDLIDDPEESEDLEDRHGARYAALLDLLQRRMAEPPLFAAARRSTELSADEREMLEELGYVSP